VITVFLRSLTRHWDGKLIAVIVSGFDGDGAAGLRGMKEVGGITIAQKLDTAVQPGMPERAIASGCIDFVLSPENIARELVRIAHAHQTKDMPGGTIRCSDGLEPCTEPAAPHNVLQARVASDTVAPLQIESRHAPGRTGSCSRRRRHPSG
jgi:hypothetical protein